MATATSTAVASMLTTVDNDFQEAKSNAETAIQNLNSFANYATADINYRGESLLFQANPNIPISPIVVADDMIREIESLANRVSSIVFNPPIARDDFEMSNTRVWQDAFTDKISTNLSGYLDTMGIPNKDFQDSIFNEAYDRNKQVLEDLLDLADTKVGARGFTYPNSMVTALKLDAQQKYEFDRNQINRDITKLVTEWARQNYQFAIEKGISFEQFHADFTYKYASTAIDVYKNLVLVSIERFKADISKYVEPIKALIEAAKLPVEVAKLNADISKENATLKLEDMKTQIQEATQVFQVNTQASIATLQNQIHALESVAKETAAFIQSASRSVIGINK